MKKTGVTIAIIGGIAMFGFAIYRYIKVQADLLKNFSYEIIDFGIQKLDMQIIKGTLSILFKSSSDIEIVVKEFIVNFYINGVPVGYVEDKEEFIIPARNQSVIPFEYTLDPQVVIGNITQIITQTIDTGDQTFEVKGFAKIKSGFIIVSLPIEYKTTLKEFLAS